MRRPTITAALLLLVLGVFLSGRAIAAISAEEVDSGEHPIVGSWVVQDESGMWPTSMVLMTFYSDGNAILTDETGLIALGAWQAIGERSAEFNLVFFTIGAPYGPTTRFLSTVEVLEDGDTFIRSSEIIGGDQVRGERILPGGATGPGYPEGIASPVTDD